MQYKKKKRLFYLIFLLLIIFTTGCERKKTISSKSFQKIMEENNFEVQSLNDQYEDYRYLKNAFLAIDDSFSYQLEYYEFINNNNAIYFFDANKNKWQDEKNQDTLEQMVNKKNYQKYIMTTNEKYRILSRIENTVIYLDVNKEYRQEVIEILKNIGYW